MILFRDSINVELAAIVGTNRLPPGRRPSKRAPARRRGSSAASCTRPAIPPRLGEGRAEARRVVARSRASRSSGAPREVLRRPKQYDFTEYALVGIRGPPAQREAPDDALKYCRQTSNISQVVDDVSGDGAGEEPKGDKGAAIKIRDRRAARPANAQAKNQLQQLKGQ